MEYHQLNIKGLIGSLAVLLSAFCFYLATVIIRVSHSYAQISSAAYTFARSLTGFLIVAAIMGFKKKLKPKPQRIDYVLGRCVFNTFALFTFYKAVEFASVAEANILNMTYPAFITVFTWIFFKGQRNLVEAGSVVMALFGIGLILDFTQIRLEIGNLWGLSSGMITAAAMIYLNLSRQYDDSDTILFYMFGLGTVISYLLDYKGITIPTRTEFLFLIACSIVGVVGQYLLTYGYLFVTNVEGSVISSTRILFAALLGPVLASDPVLNLTGWIGAGLIFISNVYLAMRKSR